MRNLTFPTLLVLVLIAGCGVTPQSSQQGAEQAGESPSKTTATLPSVMATGSSSTGGIPEDVSFEVIEQGVVPGTKRALDIRLNRKVSEEVLKSIATELKNSESGHYDQTFIGYYLPDMQLNAGYWATTHFRPELEVKILGLTAEQEEALKQQPAEPSREVIGSWLDNRPYGGHRVTIYRDDGRLFMEKKYKDGSAGTEEIVESASKKGRRFDYKKDKGLGEFYVLNIRGELELWDDEGLFVTAKKVN